VGAHLIEREQPECRGSGCSRRATHDVFNASNSLIGTYCRRCAEREVALLDPPPGRVRLNGERWPKRLRCPGCDRMRWASSPSDRYCEPCRARAERDSLGALGCAEYDGG